MTTANRFLAGAAAAALAIGLVLGGAASAQTAQNQDHEAHHPDGTASPPAPAPAPPAASTPRSGMPMPGMGGPGGQQGGAPGMMGGDMGRMMQMMHRQMAARHAMRPFERIDGQLAYYRAELRITDAQQPQWNAFADAIRAAAGGLKQAVTQAM